MDHASLNLVGWLVFLIVALVPYFAILTLFNINQTLRDLLWEVQLARVDLRSLPRSNERVASGQQSAIETKLETSHRPAASSPALVSS